MWKLLCIDPHISSAINVTDITQTSVRVSWSTGQTQVVNSIVVYYTATGATSWNTRSASQSTTHVTVSALQPETQYQFYVKISSYGRSSTSDTVTVTTGTKSSTTADGLRVTASKSCRLQHICSNKLYNKSTTSRMKLGLDHYDRRMCSKLCAQFVDNIGRQCAGQPPRPSLSFVDHTIDLP